MNNIKISIIIPVFNAEATLNKLFSSIVEQLLSEIEIIFVNDGSKDKSLSIIKKFKNQYENIIIIDQINKGVSISRNEGIKNARGEYIAFVDADDWINNDMMLKMYEKAYEFNLDVVSCSYFHHINNNVNIVCTKEIPKDRILYKREINDYIINNLIRSDEFASPWNKIYKSSFLREYNLYFKPYIRIGEDYLFNIQVFQKAKKSYCISEPLYHYISTFGSAVNTYKKDQFDLYVYLHKEKQIILGNNCILNNDASLWLIEKALYCIYKELEGKMKYKIRRINKIIKNKTLMSEISNVSINLITDNYRKYMFFSLKARNPIMIILGVYYSRIMCNLHIKLRRSY